MKFFAIFALFACTSASAVWPYASSWANTVAVRTVDNGAWNGVWNGGVRSYAAPITQYSSVPVASTWGVGSYAAQVAVPRTVAYSAPAVVAAAPLAYSAPSVVVSAPRTVAYSAPVVAAAPAVVEQRTVVAEPRTVAYSAPVVAAAPAVVEQRTVVAAEPVAYAAQPVVYAAEHGATYTAANRGSVHTAPLPGHAVSQTSLNVAPAPGTH